MTRLPTQLARLTFLAAAAGLVFGTGPLLASRVGPFAPPPAEEEKPVAPPTPAEEERALHEADSSRSPRARAGRRLVPRPRRRPVTLTGRPPPGALAELLAALQKHRRATLPPRPGGEDEHAA